jgi:hypothetical protein
VSYVALGSIPSLVECMGPFCTWYKSVAYLSFGLCSEFPPLPLYYMAYRLFIQHQRRKTMEFRNLRSCTYDTGETENLCLFATVTCDIYTINIAWNWHEKKVFKERLSEASFFQTHRGNESAYQITLALRLAGPRVHCIRPCFLLRTGES